MLTRSQTWHRPRVDGFDPDVFPLPWFTTLAEVDAYVTTLLAEYVLPPDTPWDVETRDEDVDVWNGASPVVFVEEEAGALHWIWTPEGDADSLVAFWRALPSMTEPDWMHPERRQGRILAARFLGTPGYARVDGRLIHVERPWTAHVWREHDSWLRPPLPTVVRHVHRGAVLPVRDNDESHFRSSQNAYREAGRCGRIDFSSHAVVVGIHGEPFGDGHLLASLALRLGARNGIPGPAMELTVNGVTRVVPAARELRWNGEHFACVPAALD
jgi:hypothetical protein